MGPPKECDSRNSLSAGRNNDRRSIRAVDRSMRATASAIETRVKCANRLTFAEDFMVEHSLSNLLLSNLHFSLTGIKGRSGARREQLHSPPSPQSFGFPS